jgi:hypothetical protein
MSTTGRPAASDLYRERDRIVGSDEDADRLPIYIAAPIIVALSLSLWGGIGFVVHALL